MLGNADLGSIGRPWEILPGATKSKTYNVVISKLFFCAIVVDKREEVYWEQSNFPKCCYLRPQKNWNLSGPKIGTFARIGVVINGGAGLIALKKQKSNSCRQINHRLQATVLKPCCKWHNIHCELSDKCKVS